MLDKNRNLRKRKRIAGEIVVSLSAILLAIAVGGLSIIPNPSFSKYVLDGIQYAINFASAKVSLKPITSIGPTVGSTAAGKTLTAGNVMPEDATVTYQWKKGLEPGGPYVNIAGAMEKTYILTTDENNYFIVVTATGTGKFYDEKTSAPVGPVIEASVPITSMGEITGLKKEGEILTAGEISPEDAEVTYQWQRSFNVAGPYTDIYGANSSTYTLTSADVDYYIKVVATGSGKYTGTVSAFTGPVVSSSIPITEIGPIVGTTKVGETLTAGTVTPPEANVTYQWYSSGTANGIYTKIEGATDSTYLLEESDEGRFFKVIATGIDGYSNTATSAYTGPVVANTIDIVSIGAILGVQEVGQTLTAGTINPAEATVTYQWKIADTIDGNYTNITNATSSSYLLTADDYNKYLKLEITGSGMYTGTELSTAKGPVGKQTITSIGNIVGATVVNNTVMAGSIVPYGATVTYQWRRASTAGGPYTDISGANFPTYTLIGGINERYVVVTATGTGVYTGTVTSNYIEVLDATAGNLNGMQPITGVTHVFGVLHAGTLNPYNATATYQWQKSDSYDGVFQDILGATHNTYAVKPEDKDYFIRVIATGTGLYTGEVISLPADLITAAPLVTMGQIEGTAEVGGTLTAGFLVPTNATVDYQWLKSNYAHGPYEEVLGATSNAIDLTENDVGKYFKIRATGKNLYRGTLTSDYSGPVITNTTELRSVDRPIGILEVDRVVTPGELRPIGATATYRWQRSDSGLAGTFENIPGATSRSYKFTEEDCGNYFRVVATGSGIYSGTVISPVIGPLEGRPLESISNIIGTTAFGWTLKAGYVMPHDATVTYQWQICDSSSGEFTDIEGETSKNYEIDESDYQSYLRLAVTGTGAYEGTIYSNPVGPIINPNEITGIDELEGAVSGIPQVGEMLTAGEVWPQGAIVTYQWQRSSDGEEENYEDIPGAEIPDYVLTAEDYDMYIRVKVEGAGVFSGTAKSNPTERIEAASVTSISPIEGTTSVGQILTAGTVIPIDATIEYQWLISDAWNGIYEEIEGADSDTYTITADDVDSFIKVKVTGTGAYKDTVMSNYSGPVTSSIIQIEGIENITGQEQVEEILTAGTILPEGATGTYQWQRSDDGTTFTNIIGATEANYKLTADDWNKYIRVVAKGSGVYAGSKTSNSTGLIQPCPIIAMGPIGGVAKMGSAVTAGKVYPLGATVTYQWYNSKNIHADSDYNPISAATSDTYIVNVSADLHIKVEAIGFGAYSGRVMSDHVTVTSLAETDLVAISPITGSLEIGGTLKAGALSPSDATGTYQWQRSQTYGGTYADIAGATSKDYATRVEDRGYYLRVVVTGSGGFTNEIISQAVGPITAIPISSMAAISGTTQRGETLKAGSLIPHGATVSYQWKKSSQVDGSYVDIEGANSNTYKITSADDNNYFKVTIVGTGAYTGSFTSLAVGPVSSSAIPITSIGNISGVAMVREKLTAGSIEPFGATVSYQWQYSSDGTNYQDIPGAEFDTYTIGDDYVNQYIRVAVKGSGTYSGVQYSERTQTTVSPYPITGVSPIIGTARLGEILQAGTVTPKGATVTYQWQRSGSVNGTYQDIAGETSTSYLLKKTGDQGQYIRLKVTGQAAYSGTVYSQPIGNIKNNPTVVTITEIGPITGINQVGETLTAGQLTPTGAVATYQWFRSPTLGGLYEEIHGATADNYLIREEDAGYYFMVEATGTSSVGGGGGGGGGTVYVGTVLSEKTDQIVADFTQLTAISDITGSTVVGYTLTVGTVTPEGATVTYQWQRRSGQGNFVNISGATSSTYTSVSGDQSYDIRVVATGIGAYMGSIESNPVGPITNTGTEITSMGPITGDLLVGSTISAGALVPTGATATYEWQITTGSDSGEYAVIKGENSSTLTLTNNEYNYYIRVIAYGKGNYYGSVYTYTSDKVDYPSGYEPQGMAKTMTWAPAEEELPPLGEGEELPEEEDGERGEDEEDESEEEVEEEEKELPEEEEPDEEEEEAEDEEDTEEIEEEGKEEQEEEKEIEETEEESSEEEAEEEDTEPSEETEETEEG